MSANLRVEGYGKTPSGQNQWWSIVHADADMRIAVVEGMRDQAEKIADELAALECWGIDDRNVLRFQVCTVLLPYSGIMIEPSASVLLRATT